MRKSFLFLFLVLFVISCKKENAVEVNTNYIGTWVGQDTAYFYTVKIDEDGTGEYQKTTSNSNFFTNGKTKTWKNKLKIGKQKFDLNEAPILQVDAFGNSFYRMQLDEIVYARYL